jgi:plasmid stabilization system protein ParE
MRKLFELICSLKQSPRRGRIGREEGLGRLFPPPPYVAVYLVNEQSIEAPRIYHRAQDRT